MKKKEKEYVKIDWKDEKQLTAFKILVRNFYDYQKERITLDGRIGMKKNMELKKGVPERDAAILVYLYKRREELVIAEEDFAKDIVFHVHLHPLWKAFLDHVKGCGETIAAVIISEIDIQRAPMVSNICSFAGLAPGLVKGKRKDKKTGKIIITDNLIRADKKTKGYLCPFNQFLRSKLCGVLGASFLKSHSQPYSMYYYNEKIRLENSEGLISEVREKGQKPEMIMWKDAKKDHRHKAAIRKMIKEFLKDLYVAWRTLESLSIREPYSEEYLGRKHQKAA